jgi:glutaconate CoA-transferase, subunit A
MLVTLQEAVEHINEGMTIAIGGFTLYRRPVAFIRALIQRATPPRDLTVLNFAAGIETDMLIGAGCVKAVRSVYMGLEAFGLAPMFTQMVQAGKLTIIEETEASIVCGLRAQTSGVGFMPSTAWVGTDLPRLRPDVKTIQDPYSDEKLMAFPAIAVDVLILHGLAADANGNVTINNNLGIDLELVYAADKVICTVETLVDQVKKSSDVTVIPYPGVDVVALAPRGAWPTACYPLYPLDGLYIMDYVEACNAGNFSAYISE